MYENQKIQQSCTLLLQKPSKAVVVLRGIVEKIFNKSIDGGLSMDNLKVALLQLRPEDTIEEYAAEVIEFVEAEYCFVWFRG